MDLTEYYEQSLMLHGIHKGILEIISKAPVLTRDDLATVYMPGVTEPCRMISQDPENARRYTIKANTVAVVSDGSAVPGLGNIGGLAALPAVEGKAALLKGFGGIDAFPLCLDTQDADRIVETIKNVAPGFGGIVLESISAPRCFAVERRLKEALDIPVFHDGQHGAAIAAAAAAINAFRLLGKPLSAAAAVICGAGAAGNATAKMLNTLGVRDMVVCDSRGIVSANRIHEFEEDKLELLEFTNREGLTGGLSEAVRDRDLFIGFSKPGLVSAAMVRSMAKYPVIFALADPGPEIMPDLARAAGAFITGTGRPDFPNQISNVLVLPGVLRGALDACAAEITDAMKAAAAYALAGQVPDSELSEDHVLPPVLSAGTAAVVAEAVAQAWEKGRI